MLIAFVIYLLALTASTIFGQTPYLSFWGDAERMMGLFGMLHFFVLFLIGTSLFNPYLNPLPSKGGGNREGDLMLLLKIFVAITSVVALHGIFQHFGFTGIKPGQDRIVATVGNAGVLAGYLIFGLFFSLFLALMSYKSSPTLPKGREPFPPFKGGRGDFWRGWGGFFPLGFIYLVATALHLYAIFLTGTRGAYLGVAAGFLFAFIVRPAADIVRALSARDRVPEELAAKGKGNFGSGDKGTERLGVGDLPSTKGNFGSGTKKLLAAFALIVLFAVFVLIASNTGWIKTDGSLYRLTHFSLADSTIQTRFLSWKAGLEGFLERPILGWGFENFATAYNKNFDPVYYNFVKTDEYFDRAHNIIVELLATAGILGLLSYLLLLAAVVYCIVKALRRGGESRDFICLSIFLGLLIAYFIQNLFIFDLLPTMLGFVTFLIAVNSFASVVIPSESEESPRPAKAGRGNEVPHTREILRPQAAGPRMTRARIRPVFLAIPAAALIFGLIYFYANFVVRPFQSLKDNVFGQVFIEADYASGMKYLKRSVSRDTYLDLDIRSAAANTIYNYYKDRGIESENKKPDIDFAVSLYKKDLEILPNDNYYNYKISEILNFRFAIDFDQNFNEEANNYAKKAIGLAPGRANSRHILTENFLLVSKFDEAISAAKEAVALNDRYGSSYWELTKAYYTKGDFIQAKENLVKTINFGHSVSDQNMERFASLFDPAKSSQNQIEYFELIVKNGTTNYMYDSTLAALYYEIGNKEEAISHAKRAAELNPAVKDKIGRFIKKVEETL